MGALACNEILCATLAVPAHPSRALMVSTLKKDIVDSWRCGTALLAMNPCEYSNLALVQSRSIETSNSWQQHSSR